MLMVRSEPMNLTSLINAIPGTISCTYTVKLQLGTVVPRKILYSSNGTNYWVTLFLLA